ncbi:MalY/PatB family protein [Subtercola endophyticus]|uniref:MalY/PatB family protein n=1 Tax=Subtercola endophyticus TaxID=2895559 RepID=UPI001E37ED9F|nr:aminotransferase class I/II-fold pyridoxal phosphate-dependent enzyme [Subtercola endophyticus]UFS59264.1 aminotransferase class I/II-fold pyridoxal phosphate-dependent enzyme [Subtercola endophyticus]
MDLLRADPLAQLRQRTSVKWRAYPHDVLPLFVAEMDYSLAEPVKRAMIRVIENSDVGYIGEVTALAEPFAAFAAERWGWMIEPSNIRTTTDVSVAAVEALRQAIGIGDGVIIMPPVYPPFFEYVTEAGGRVVEVPLLESGPVDADDHASSADFWSIDLAGVEAALQAGARAVLLCNPHNPLGLLHSAADLEALASLAFRFDAVVVCDEIHGPLAYESRDFTPFLSVSEAARAVGITLTSASKGWNLAGAKCAMQIAQSDRTLAMLDALPDEVHMRTSQLGLHGSIAAFAEAVPWLDQAIEAIRQSAELLRELLAAQLPGVVFRRPQASYLAWLDFRALGWGDDPSVVALESAKVALMAGPEFGRQGAGFVRLNLACSPEVLTEAVGRLARVAGDRGAESASAPASASASASARVSQ